MSEAAAASATGLPWWGWLIIGIVALAVLIYGTVAVFAFRAYRSAKREIDSLNLGPSRLARSRHFTDPF